MLAFALALLKRRLELFHGEMEGDGTLETQGAVSLSTQINRLAKPQSPVHGSLERFSYDPVEEPNFHRQHSHTTLASYLRLFLLPQKDESHWVYLHPHKLTRITWWSV